MILRWEPEALAALADIRDRAAGPNGTKRARVLLAALEHAAEGLARLPHSAPMLGPVHLKTVERTHRLVYLVDGDTVRILDVIPCVSAIALARWSGAQE